MEVVTGVRPGWATYLGSAGKRDLVALLVQVAAIALNLTVLCASEYSFHAEGEYLIATSTAVREAW